VQRERRGRLEAFYTIALKCCCLHEDIFVSAVITWGNNKVAKNEDIQGNFLIVCWCGELENVANFSLPLIPLS
jgi:hypothetical protein